MERDVIKEYLVALKAKVDTLSIKKAEEAVQRLDKGVASLLKGFGAAAGVYASVAAGLYKFATASARQDLALENTARRLMTSKEQVRQYGNALKALGASIEDIQLSPELRADFSKLVSDGKRLALSGDYAKGAKEVRSFLFEAARLRQELGYALQWAGYHITKNLIEPFRQGRKSLADLNEAVIKRIPEFSANIGRIAGQVGQVFASTANFFGQVIGAVRDFWTGLPDWAKKAALAGGIIGLLAFGVASPVAGVAMLVGAVMLLIDDYVAWQQGKKNALGAVWLWLRNNVGGVKSAVEGFAKGAVQSIGSMIKWFQASWPKLTQFWTDLNKCIELSFRDVMNFFDNIPKWAEGCVNACDGFFAQLGKGFETVGWITTHPAEAIASLSAGADFWNLLPGSDNVDADVRRRSAEARARGRAEAGAYEGLIQEAAQKYGVNPNLIRAVIKQESNFNPKAVSAAGAQGLGQLMPATAKAMGVSDPFDPRQNVFGTARYLKELGGYGFGTAGEVIAAYNAGPGAVQAAGGIPAYPETQAYVRKVLGYFNGYEANRGGVISGYKQLAQSNRNSCGQTSVASIINLMKGTSYTDKDINVRYGFGLQNALNAETGTKWASPDFSRALWPNIERAVNAGFPVSIGLGGKFTSSNGHIMNIVGIDGESVILGDPNGGGFRTTTRREIENVPGHSQGKFLFLPEQFMPGQRTASLTRLMALASAGMQMAAPFNDVSTALAGSNINITNGGVTVNVNSSNASPQDIASAVSDAYGAVKQAEYYALSRTLNNAWMG
jgi:hypothetical protein